MIERVARPPLEGQRCHADDVVRQADNEYTRPHFG